MAVVKLKAFIPSTYDIEFNYNEETQLLNLIVRGNTNGILTIPIGGGSGVGTLQEVLLNGNVASTSINLTTNAKLTTNSGETTNDYKGEYGYSSLTLWDGTKNKRYFQYDASGGLYLDNNDWLYKVCPINNDTNILAALASNGVYFTNQRYLIGYFKRDSGNICIPINIYPNGVITSGISYQSTKAPITPLPNFDYWVLGVYGSEDDPVFNNFNIYEVFGDPSIQQNGLMLYQSVNGQYLSEVKITSDCYILILNPH